jgi:hypothetical protein
LSNLEKEVLVMKNILLCGVVVVTVLTAQYANGEAGKKEMRHSPQKKTEIRHLPQKKTGVELVLEVSVARKLPGGLVKQDRDRLKHIVGELKRNEVNAANKQWGQLVRVLSDRKTTLADINSTIQWVLRESYVDSNKDLRENAERVRYFNDLKKDVRKHLEGLGRYRNQFRPGVKNLRMTVPSANALPPYRPGKTPHIAWRGKVVDRSQLENEIVTWEEKLGAIGDDAQLANIDLQNALQRQQQTLQTMSNVSKMLHDTAMAVVRKIG